MRLKGYTLLKIKQITLPGHPKENIYLTKNYNNLDIPMKSKPLNAYTS